MSEIVGRSAYVIAIAGVVALVAIVLFFAVGQPFGTINDLSAVVETLALAPVMFGFYELGGRTPITAARVSLVSGVAAVLVWSIVQVAMVLGLVTFDYVRPAIGGFAIEAVALIVIGAWLSGANLLAGPWLPGRLRWLGAMAGFGFALLGLGLLLGGLKHTLTYLGGVGYQLLFPLWGLLLGRVLDRRS